MKRWIVVLTRHPRGAPDTARHQILHQTAWCWWARLLAFYVALKERPSWACPQVTVTVYEAERLSELEDDQDELGDEWYRLY